MIAPNFIRHGFITKCYDGDTCTCNLILMKGLIWTINIRLLGINAPEMHAPTLSEAIKARDYLANMILGKDVLVETPNDEYDKYGGRIDGRIYINDKDVNQAMLDSGLVVKYQGVSNKKLIETKAKIFRGNFSKKFLMLSGLK